MFLVFNFGSFNCITCDDLIILCDKPPEDVTLLSKNMKGSFVYIIYVSYLMQFLVIMKTVI
jgi:hypothetical protein